MNKLKFVERKETDVREKKRALREFMKERRGANVNRDVKECLLVENFFKATEGLSFEKTFVYYSFSSEVPTDELIERLLADGKRVFAPRAIGAGMEFAEISDDFELSELGIKEPVGQATEEAPDVVVLPLLAVDKLGNRLGYGKGYYDRFLKTCNALKVAYAFDFQVVEEVPREETDERVDVIVTDERIVWINKPTKDN